MSRQVFVTIFSLPPSVYLQFILIEQEVEDKERNLEVLSHFLCNMTDRETIMI